MRVAVLMRVLYWNLTRSRVGRAFVAIREREMGAEQMGVNVPLYKALAFGISSLYAGIAGGLFFMVQAFVGPESMGFFDSILFLVAVVIGGLGTILGSVIGAIFLTFQGEAIDKLSDAFSQARNLRGVIYGGLLIGFMLLFPRGLAGFVHGQEWRPQEVWGQLPTRLGALRDAAERRPGRGQPPDGTKPSGRGGSSA